MCIFNIEQDLHGKSNTRDVLEICMNKKHYIYLDNNVYFVYLPTNQYFVK